MPAAMLEMEKAKADIGVGRITAAGVRSFHPMRWLVAIVIALSPFAARAGNLPFSAMYGITANDTGGVIQWSPEIAHIYRAIAADYCARWDRVAHITSVHRRYGDFVGFTCNYDRRYDPRKVWALGGW
jgi:hypothetical protein